MFFTKIAQLMTQGVDLSIVIRTKDNEMVVSVLPKSNTLKDDAQHHIVPLTLTGTPAEIDAGFLQTIAQPMQRTAGLIVNLEQFEQQAEKASANSRAAKEAQAKESKEQKEKREKHEKFIKKADELIAAKKYDEALTNLQQARLHATEQTTKTVDDKIAEVKSKLNQGSLFAMEQLPPMQSPIPQPQVEPMTVQSQQAPPPPQYAAPQMQPPQASTVPPIPAAMFADEYRHPSPASQPFDPAYCRPDEYAAYPDFPGYMNPPMSNQSQIF